MRNVVATLNMTPNWTSAKYICDIERVKTCHHIVLSAEVCDTNRGKKGHHFDLVCNTTAFATLNGIRNGNIC